MTTDVTKASAARRIVHSLTPLTVALQVRCLLGLAMEERKNPGDAETDVPELHCLSVQSSGRSECEVTRVVLV